MSEVDFKDNFKKYKCFVVNSESRLKKIINSFDDMIDYSNPNFKNNYTHNEVVDFNKIKFEYNCKLNKILEESLLLLADEEDLLKSLNYEVDCELANKLLKDNNKIVNEINGFLLELVEYEKKVVAEYGHKISEYWISSIESNLEYAVNANNDFVEDIKNLNVANKSKKR